MVANGILVKTIQCYPNKLEIGFKPNKHELYLFNKEIEKRENRVREREQGREWREGEKIENFEIFYLIHLNMKKFHGGLGRRRRGERKKVTSSSTEKTHTLKKEKFLIKR